MMQNDEGGLLAPDGLRRPGMKRLSYKFLCILIRK